MMMHQPDISAAPQMPDMRAPEVSRMAMSVTAILQGYLDDENWEVNRGAVGGSVEAISCLLKDVAAATGWEF